MAKTIKGYVFISRVRNEYDKRKDLVFFAEYYGKDNIKFIDYDLNCTDIYVKEDVYNKIKI